MPDRIVAIGLLNARDLERLGSGFSRAFAVDESPCFDELLIAIDIADGQMRETADQAPAHLPHAAQRCKA
ncbi:hypothetical protein [Sphingomonas xinjiangensis]|uniref:Uncharacterized protein n=1 Tax=Sphingomonas xinjiangensis TaxID=643568 RepID=A0A840YCL0_9SPHN|nr:hypothetical protein [Sphingomonas xinjiangensis]MBB5709749.1 hypothetical protein [Sphingomonas xinjiangensis]